MPPGPAQGEVSFDQPADGAARRQRGQGEHASELCRQMAGVAGKDLVATHTAEDHGELATGRGADQVGRDGGGVGHRLIHVPDQLRQQLDDIGLQGLLVVVDVKAIRDLAGIADVVGHDLVRQVRVCSNPTVKVVTRSLDAAHLGHDRARVDAAAQEASERYIADHLAPNRRAYFVSEGLCPFPLGPVLGREAHVPVLRDLQPPSRERRIMPWRQLVDPVEQRVGVGNPEKGQILGDDIASQGRTWQCREQCFDLGGEVERPLALSVIEGFTPRRSRARKARRS